MPLKYRTFFPPGGSPKEPGRAVGIAGASFSYKPRVSHPRTHPQVSHGGKGRSESLGQPFT